MNHLDAAPDDRHTEAMALLPWYVNGTLSGEERERVRAHLKGCRRCREELILSQALARRLNDAGVKTPPAQQSLAHLRQRLQPREHRRAGRRSARLTETGLVWRRLALVAGIVLVVAPWSWQPGDRPSGPEFRTLSDRRPPVTIPGGDLRLVVDPSVDAARLQAMLDAIAGQAHVQPGTTDVWTVRLSSHGIGERDAAVAFLRRQEGVLLVEPIVQPKLP